MRRERQTLAPTSTTFGKGRASALTLPQRMVIAVPTAAVHRSEEEAAAALEAASKGADRGPSVGTDNETGGGPSLDFRTHPPIGLPMRTGAQQAGDVVR